MQQPIRFFTKRAATELTGGVSKPSKMPCNAWSIPVFMCKRGSTLAKVEGSVCSKCYADRGFYNVYRDQIEPAQVARLDAIYSEPDWVEAMVTLIGNDPHFRWFDAGDLQDVFMLRQIVEVCRLTPNTEHWLPTREYEIVAEFLAGGGQIPENLVIRLSAFMFDQQVKIPAALRGVPGIATSEAHTKPTQTRECPAPKQDNKCGECRACWDRSIPAVSYHAH